MDTSFSLLSVGVGWMVTLNWKTDIRYDFRELRKKVSACIWETTGSVLPVQLRNFKHGYLNDQDTLKIFKTACPGYMLMMNDHADSMLAHINEDMPQ